MKPLELKYDEIKPKEIVLTISCEKALKWFNFRAALAKPFFIIGAFIFSCPIEIEFKMDGKGE